MADSRHLLACVDIVTTHRKHINVGGIKYSIGKWVLFFAIIPSPVKIIYICMFIVLLTCIFAVTYKQQAKAGGLIPTRVWSQGPVCYAGTLASAA